jgi:hypothetical protein
MVPSEDQWDRWETRIKAVFKNSFGGIIFSGNKNERELSFLEEGLNINRTVCPGDHAGEWIDKFFPLTSRTEFTPSEAVLQWDAAKKLPSLNGIIFHVAKGGDANKHEDVIVMTIRSQVFVESRRVNNSTLFSHIIIDGALWPSTPHWNLDCNEPGKDSVICYNFQDRGIVPTYYSICHDGSRDPPCFEDCGVKISMDCQMWVRVDTRRRYRTSAISQSAKGRYMRFVYNTSDLGPNHNHTIYVWEIFGTLLE